MTRDKTMKLGLACIGYGLTLELINIIGISDLYTITMLLIAIGAHIGKQPEWFYEKHNL